MIGSRIKQLRLAKELSLTELGELVSRSAATISRIENNIKITFETNLIKQFAISLDTSTAYLLGITDDPNLISGDVLEKYMSNGTLKSIIVKDNDMSPELPQGAVVQIRPMEENEKIQIGSFYYVTFNDKSCFRMAIKDEIDGIGFLPIDISERRISYDLDYVEIIGKAISMNVFFKDETK